MTPDDRPLGYWDELAAGSKPLVELIQEAAGEDWTVRGAIVPGESDDGETLFTLVLRHRVGDAGLVVRLGFCTVSLDEPQDPVSWSEDNYLDMRVQGCLPDALALLFTSDGMGDLEDPTTIDARKANVTAGENAEVLEQDFQEVSTVEERDVGQSSSDHDRDTSESVEPGETSDTVRCEDCGKKIPREEAENFGSDGFGVDVWVHAGKCPEEGEQ